MPILPPTTALPYDTVNDVLNVARARMNDELVTLKPVGGKILKNTQVFSQQTVNTAWRKLQEYLAEKGYARLTAETVILALPVVASPDPGTQVWLNWAGYFDGVNYWPTPALPPDLSHPLKVWERWNGQNSQFGEPPMEKVLDGLPSVMKVTSNRYWEWREDTIFMPGSQMIEDLRIRYVTYLPDFLDSGNEAWFNMLVPIMRISDAFSWYICAELLSSRGDDARAEIILGRGEAALCRIFTLDVRADQRVNIRRRPRTGRGYGRAPY